MDVVNQDYFSQLKLLCRYRFDTEIFAFCISNNKIQENDTGDGYNTYFLSNEFAESLPGFGKENIDNVFYNADHIGRKKVFQKLVEVLESNINPIYCATQPLDEEWEERIIEVEERKFAWKALEQLFTVGGITQVQKRRFILHTFHGWSTRKISQMEGISHQAVAKSINLALKKLRNFFAAQG